MENEENEKTFKAKLFFFFHFIKSLYKLNPKALVVAFHTTDPLNPLQCFEECEAKGWKSASNEVFIILIIYSFSAPPEITVEKAWVHAGEGHS